MPLNIDFQQVLLHLFNFVVLFGGLYFLLYKPIRAFMDKREETYSNMQEKATKALAEAEAMKQEYQEKLKEAEADIAEMKRKAEGEIQEARESELEEARKEAREIMAKAHREAMQEKDKVMHQARKEVRQLAEDATRKLAGRSLLDLYDQFLDQAEGNEPHETP